MLFMSHDSPDLLLFARMLRRRLQSSLLENRSRKLKTQFLPTYKDVTGKDRNAPVTRGLAATVLIDDAKKPYSRIRSISHWRMRLACASNKLIIQMVKSST